MRQQNKIMSQQLRLQKIENTQKAMKSFQYMMDYGKVPPLGYGYWIFFLSDYGIATTSLIQEI